MQSVEGETEPRSMGERLNRADVFLRVWAVGRALSAAGAILERASGLGLIQKIVTGGGVEYKWDASFRVSNKVSAAGCKLSRMGNEYRLEAQCAIGHTSGRVRVVCDRNILIPPAERLRVLGILEDGGTTPAFYRNGHGAENDELHVAGGLASGFLQEVRVNLGENVRKLD